MLLFDLIGLWLPALVAACFGLAIKTRQSLIYLQVHSTDLSVSCLAHFDCVFDRSGASFQSEIWPAFSFVTNLKEASSYPLISGLPLDCFSPRDQDTYCLEELNQDLTLVVFNHKYFESALTTFLSFHCFFGNYH